uniref:Protein cueball n=1 Tax=Clastoptera arizonana TaxID=38151 RepID=A0A1B6CTF3_9HEMI
MEIQKIILVLYFISSPFAVSTWDIAVAVGNEIQFLNSTGSIVAHISESMGTLQALTYNPEQQLIFFSDNELTNGSIFSFQVSSSKTNPITYHNLKAIVTEQNDTVQHLAYDYKTQILYWTNGYGHQIKWLKLNSTDSPQPGQILHNFKSKVTAGIAIDSCKRYLYWSNSQTYGATIERSLLDGSKLEVLINENLDQPLGIVLDQSSQRMFWIDDLRGNSYKIESATFTGQDRRTVIHGTHHQPFALTVHGGYIYWTDRTNNDIWRLPVEANNTLDPIRVLDMKSLPMGITSSNQMMSNNLNLECNDVVEPTLKKINATIETVSPSTIEKATNLNINVSDYCLNQGLLKSDAITCNCLPQYTGNRCEIDLCHNYCSNGICEVDSSGFPRCRKCSEGWSGDKCEISVCYNYCVRGSCIVERNSLIPKCQCQEGWSGDRCEISHFEKQNFENQMFELCENYCRLYTSSEKQHESLSLPNCKCSNDIKVGESNSSASNDYITYGEYREACVWKEVNEVLLLTLGLLCVVLLILVLLLTKKVLTLRKRPRIKKRIIVSKNITPLTCRPQPEQCEITIENCCNMNVCETHP